MVVGSVAVHVIALYVVHIARPRVPTGDTIAHKTSAHAAASDDITYSCVADAYLATSAQLTYCATPFSETSSACLRRTRAAHHKAVASCKPPTEVLQLAMVDVKTLDRIKPMSILPLLQPIKQKEFEKQQQKKIEQKHLAAQKRIANPRAAGQVVEITRPRLEMTPDKARYVSKYDSTVKRQTVARGSTEKMVRAPSPDDIPTAKTAKPLPDKLTAKVSGKAAQKLATTEPPVPDTPSKATKIADKVEAPKPGALSMRKPGTKRILASKAPGLRSGLTSPMTADGAATRRGEHGFRAARPETPATAAGEGGGTEGTRREKVPNLFPSKELLRRTVGGGSVDNLDGVAKGKFTALNTRRWKFAGFFNRLKRQVARNWHPARAYLHRDPNGNVYGTKDRITIVKVTLTPTGSVDGIFVTRGSGVGFLDDEAIRAFRAAQPFPNPPGALVSKRSQKITFSFGFHFQVGQRNRWRVFRYR